MNSFTDKEMDRVMCEILLEMLEDPRFSFEDVAATIREKVIKPYQSFLFMNFAISAEAYERTRV